MKKLLCPLLLCCFSPIIGQSDFQFSGENWKEWNQVPEVFEVQEDALWLNAPASSGIAVATYDFLSCLTLDSIHFEGLFNFNPSSSNYAQLSLKGVNSTLTFRVGKNNDQFEVLQEPLEGSATAISAFPVEWGSTQNHYRMGARQLPGHFLLIDFHLGDQSFQDTVYTGEMDLCTLEYTVKYTSTRSTKSGMLMCLGSGKEKRNIPTISYSYPSPYSMQVSLDSVPEGGWRLYHNDNWTNLHQIQQIVFEPHVGFGDSLNLVLQFNYPDTVLNIPKTVFFSPQRKPKPGELFFSEVMADPTPPIGLPNTEYIEIFNRSEWPIALDSIWIKNEAQKYNWGVGGVINPGQFWVLSKDTLMCNSCEMSSPWRSLENNADSLSLGTDSILLDHLVYQKSWWGDSIAGGRSLERRLFQSCENRNNWHPSTSFVGGSPGQENTVSSWLPWFDLRILDRSTLTLHTNLTIEQEDLTCSDSEGILAAFLDQNEVPFAAEPQFPVTLQIATPFCPGLIQESYTLQLPPLPNHRDVFLSEVLADPFPDVGLGAYEFIEIVAQKPFFGRDVTLGVNGNSWTLPDSVFPSGVHVFSAQQYQIPTLPNSGFSLTLQVKGLTLDSLSYTPSLHDPHKSSGGFSLSRLDTTACLNQWNWASSQDSLGGNPRLWNRQPKNIHVASTQDSIVFSAQPLKEWEGLALEGRLSINEVLVSNSLNPSDNWEPFWFQEGWNSVRLDDLKLCTGKDTLLEFQMLYLEEATLGPHDLMVSEILAHPETGQMEFVELWNSSNHWIVLDSIYLGVNQSLSPLAPSFLPPHGTQVYSTQNTIGFPALSNSGFDIRLHHGEDLTLEKWHVSSQIIEKGESLHRQYYSESCALKNPWFLDVPNPGSLWMEPLWKEDTLEISSFQVTGNRLVIQLNLPTDCSGMDLEDFVIPELTLEAVECDSTGVLTFLFQDPIPEGDGVQIWIPNGLHNCLGTSFGPLAWFIPNGRAPLPGELIFSELLPDPTPAASDTLFKEFIELHNRSEAYLDLNHLKVKRDNKVLELSGTMAPGEHQAWNTDQGLFSLPNAGFTICLTDSLQVLDSIVYVLSDWSGVKSAGGYSLERKFYNEPCAFSPNWDFTLDTLGATPGRGSELGGTKLFPEVIGVGYSASWIEISLNTPVVQLDSAHPFPVSWMASEIWMEKPTTEGVYTIELFGVSDCFHQKIDTSFDFVVGRELEKGGLFICEFLPANRSDQAEFVEVQITDTGYFSLGGLRLEIGGYVVGTKDTVVQGPSTLVFGDSLGLEASGSVRIPNSVEEIKLKQGEETLDSIPKGLLETVNYSWETPRSIEKKMIDLPCKSAHNWVVNPTDHSYHVPFADAIPTGKNQIPYIDSIFNFSRDSLVVFWGTPVEHFEFDSSTFSTTWTDPIAPQHFRYLGKEAEFTLSISDLTNCYGVQGSDTSLAFTSYFRPNDTLPVFISECFCPNEPDSNQAPYIELYNPTDYPLQMGNLQLEDHQISDTIIQSHECLLVPQICDLKGDSIFLKSSRGTVLDSCINPTVKNAGIKSWKRRLSRRGCIDPYYEWDTGEELYSPGNWQDVFHEEPTQLEIKVCPPTVSLVANQPISTFHLAPNTHRNLERSSSCSFELSMPDNRFPFEATVIDSIRFCNQAKLTDSLPFIQHPDSIWINEIMYDPGENGEEYLELGVQAQNHWTLCGMELSINGGMKTIPDSGIYTGNQLVVLSKDTMAIQSYFEVWDGVFLEMALGNLSNSGAEIRITYPTLEDRQILEYDPKWHVVSTTDRKGKSLELMVGSEGEWTTSGHPKGGTPGQVNAMHAVDGKSWDPLGVEYRIFNPQANQKVTLRLEKLEPGNRVSAGVIHPGKGWVRTLLDEALLPTQAEISWDGKTESGVLAPSGPYLLRVYVETEGGIVRKIRESVFIQYD